MTVKLKNGPSSKLSVMLVSDQSVGDKDHSLFFSLSCKVMLSLLGIVETLATLNV